MDKVDYLDVDKPIPGQNYTCISFVSPDELIKQKELFIFNKYMNQRCGELEKNITDIIEKCSDDIKNKIERDLVEKVTHDKIRLDDKKKPINNDDGIIEVDDIINADSEYSQWRDRDRMWLSRK